MSPRSNPPIIVIGMHRSGTTLLVHLLSALGIFTGWRKDPFGEALFFQFLNEWLLRQTGGAWDNPASFQTLFADRDAYCQVVDYLRDQLQCPRNISYLGPRNYLASRSFTGLQMPWAWKDPRNTFTLPLWLELFPDAKVIHIRRHGVDVANSLRMRCDLLLQQEKQRYQRWRRAHVVWPKRRRFSLSPRCATLEGGLSLWEQYMSEADAQVSALDDRVCELRYEEILRDPSAAVETLARFCGTTARSPEINAVAKTIEPDRAFAYKQDSKLCAFADDHATRLAAHGY